MVTNIIAEGTSLKGDISLKGTLRIEGRFEGIIYNKGKVYISKTAKVFSDIHGIEVVIGGLVLGNVFGEKNVKILKTGHLRGNVYTASLSAEEGGVFEGDCVMIREKAETKPTR